MDDILDELEAAARRCERSARKFETDPVSSMISRLIDACQEVGESSSNSWLGYQSTLYLEGFRPARGGEYFDREWGEELSSFTNRTSGDWVYCTYDDVLDEVKDRAEVPDFAPIHHAAKEADEAFERSKAELLPLLDALISVHEDATLKEYRSKALELRACVSQSDYIRFMQPKGQFLTRDTRAMSEGMRPPLHLQVHSYIAHLRSYGVQTKSLADQIRHIKRYLEVKHRMKGKSIAKTEGKITIGHGGSNEWKVLKDFLQEKLGLEVDEFNQSSAAGMTNKERLEEMLDDSAFAFLIMTAENLDPAGKKHARENVIHEVGLFQGRLGFRRAIILLELGCEEFSNIVGIQQIRFESGRLKEVFEDIRDVLRREKIIR